MHENCLKVKGTIGRLLSEHSRIIGDSRNQSRNDFLPFESPFSFLLCSSTSLFGSQPRNFDGVASLMQIW
ncbi:hypothetical protein TIFTF001_015308 [Ficus carica]|uniref:Uncharacterized protein n=1 Tax=Ficus carica TaxID=3494 RepID=A0AA88D6F3_FICCA|nr:hypothetical protein TIFTF001_015308 [Ficus carica]